MRGKLAADLDMIVPEGGTTYAPIGPHGRFYLVSVEVIDALQTSSTGARITSTAFDIDWWLNCGSLPEDPDMPVTSLSRFAFMTFVVLTNRSLGDRTVRVRAFLLDEPAA